MSDHTTDPTPLKQCNKCGEWKPATPEHFRIHKQNRSGFRSPCKACQNKPPKPSTVVRLTCAICNAEFTRVPSAIKNGKGVFYCSLQCAGKGFSQIYQGENTYQYSKVEVQCAECGKALLRKRSHAARLKNNFCSRKCMGEWHSKHEAGTSSPFYKSSPVPCKQCGKGVIAHPARINENGNFCNLVCFGDWLSANQTGPNNPLWEGGAIRYYGPSWSRQRSKTRERDNNTCQRCGITSVEAGQKLDVHHKIPFRQFGIELHKEANHLSNLVTLCRKCHLEAESEYKKPRRKNGQFASLTNP